MFVKELRIALEPKRDIANTFHLDRSITTCWCFIKTRGARGPKSKTARSTFKKKNVVWAAVLCARSPKNLYWKIVRTDGIKGHNSPRHAVSATSTFV